MKKAWNEKGLTLVEILAALVILGIFFVGILTIFPQMTLFNNKTEAKLDTMNLARQEISKIVAEEKWKGKRNVNDASIFETFQLKLPVVMSSIKDEDGNSTYVIDNSNSNVNFARYKKEGKYQYEVDIYLKCEPFLTSTAVANLACSDPNVSQLHKVHLKVFKENQLSSETFSYIKFSVEKPGG
ncbi:type II secretion system protein [Planococcus sp. N064]|uniref:Type II secretion system protein n=1 Tax=Planococcus liqunii TaxID=3058394 RepID=A0ABT8MPZ9_9BACL|nr:type II secretion system protein [Planococcus sp. N064]MDN7226972.1 type II secretion system protein [Planococcus sp. N064]